MPKVSVLMSVYNKGQFLREAMLSVFAQTFTDFEFVIYDNCSTDNSVTIIEEFIDSRIRLYRNSRNVGPATSLNNCIEAAGGEYLVFFHGDDIWEETFLETNIDYLNRFPSINVCHSLMHSIDANGNKSFSQNSKNAGEFEITPYENVLGRLFKGCYVKTPTVVYRHNVMRFYDFRYTYACDWDMYLHLAASGNNFIVINKPLMYYRTSAGNETSAGVRGGNLIVEGYMVLRSFFSLYPAYARFSCKSFKRLSDATLRRARDAETRDQVNFLLRCAIMFSPVQLINPGYYLYLFIGLIFGPVGLKLLKSSRKKGVSN
ncbi:MAG: glycosyltransferase [Geobacteraceae bacterium]|nr:glycosyltransferase [Geobacteraceae bacterium]